MEIRPAIIPGPPSSTSSTTAGEGAATARCAKEVFDRAMYLAHPERDDNWDELEAWVPTEVEEA